jgi:two-component system, OmpR family, response regulator
MRLLVVEDEHQLARNIQKYLLLEQYAVDVAFDGGEGLEKALLNSYDCIVLDLNLPTMDGRQICTELRTLKNQTPIIMLTAQSGMEDIVSGLDTGADDYLTKPFEMEELVARIRAIIRRKSADSAPVLEAGGVRMDTITHRVERKGKEVRLAPKEFVLLEYLLRNRGRVAERTVILGHVWGVHEDALLFSQTLDVHIAYLRKKLGKDLITTVPGRGYMISDDM